jgi:hypothetical protein
MTSADGGLPGALSAPGPLLAVELRPPRAGLGMEDSLEAWIDLRHGVRRLLREGRPVLFTDDAVGMREEESLRHLVDNLGADADLSRVAPFLTLRHPLPYCALFARRAQALGMGGIVVTGGDEASGVPRCLPRSRDLRQRLRDAVPSLPLGVWTNPLGDPREQVGYLVEGEPAADWFVSQVVSHHQLPELDRFLEEATTRGLTLPGLFGVFYYRSGNPETLARLGRFLPVPAEGLAREFEEGRSPEEICARTLRALRERGVDKVYLSNLPLRRAALTLERIEGLL